MLKFWMPAAALALALAGPANAQALDAAAYAEALQPIVGQVYEGGVRISAIHAEQNILVVVVDGPDGWREGLSERQVSALFMDGFCEDEPPDFFSSGLAIRVDSLDGGQDLRRGPPQLGCS